MLLQFLSLAGAAISVVPSAFLRLYAAAQPWLAPPYLFITVHLIILIIWKLSDQVHHHQQAIKATSLDPSSSSPSPVPSQFHKKASPLLLEDHLKVSPFERSATLPTRTNPPLKFLSRISSFPESSIQYDRIKASPLGPSMKRSKSRIPKSPESRMIGKHVSPFEPSTPFHSKMAPFDPYAFELEEMKSSKWMPITPAMAMAAGDGDGDPDELNRLFDEFIKKKYDQMRLESKS